MTCDPVRSHKKTVEGLLEAGVHVALLYGDADFRSDCMSFFPNILTYSLHPTDDKSV